MLTINGSCELSYIAQQASVTSIFGRGDVTIFICKPSDISYDQGSYEPLTEQTQ